MSLLNPAAVVAAVQGPWQFAALVAVLIFLFLVTRGPDRRR